MGEEEARGEATFVAFLCAVQFRLLFTADGCNYEGISASQGRHNLKREACCITNINLRSPVLLYIVRFQPRFRTSFVTSPVVGYVAINWAGHVAGMGLKKNAYKISVGSEEAEWNTHRLQDNITMDIKKEARTVSLDSFG